jgi:hypothetical protein
VATYYRRQEHMIEEQQNMDGKDVVRDAAYHDAHLRDADEWDEGSAETVQPKPSAMAVFSLRLPLDEFNLLKQEAERRSTSMSELTRTALRGYLQSRVNVSLSWAASIQGLQVFSYTTPYQGGVGWYGETLPARAPSQQGQLALTDPGQKR